jgi:hypothetical protein
MFNPVGFNYLSEEIFKPMFHAGITLSTNALVTCHTIDVLLPGQEQAVMEKLRAAEASQDRTVFDSIRFHLPIPISLTLTPLQF